MLRMFAPSAVTPPSAKTKACVVITTASTRHASQGPSRIAASAAPRKCPLVPPATGKFSIWAAKTNAPVTPTSGTRRSSSRASARLTLQASVPAVTTPVTSATSVLRKPSGMCMALASLAAGRADADDREVAEPRLEARHLADRRADAVQLRGREGAGAPASLAQHVLVLQLAG